MTLPAVVSKLLYKNITMVIQAHTTTRDEDKDRGKGTNQEERTELKGEQCRNGSERQS